MKYIIFVPDGMSGLPLDELNGRTCMEAASTKNMDMIARKGVVGTILNVPKGMIPASDVANLSILGYSPSKYYCGRGPLEAAYLDVDLLDADVAFRFNFVTISGGKMMDYSAGHISSREGKVLADELDDKLGNEKFKFYAGFSYRNLLKISCADSSEADKLSKINCMPPHDILGKPYEKYLPQNDDIAELMIRSQDVLAEHDINKVRLDLKQNPANMIWLWGQGKKPDMPHFIDAYGISGGIISAVDLIKGMGKVLGLEVVEVEGATGYYDTNYEGKADAALKALEKHDLVFIHVEAPDEAGHNGDILAKINAIENFDNKIVGPVLSAFSENPEFKMLLLPDHPTPIKLRTHTREAVPFIMAGKGIESDDVTVFNENAAQAGSLHLKHGHELMKRLLRS